MFDYARFIRNVVIYTLNLAQFASLSLSLLYLIFTFPTVRFSMPCKLFSISFFAFYFVVHFKFLFHIIN